MNTQMNTRPIHLGWISCYDVEHPKDGWQEASARLMHAVRMQTERVNVMGPVDGGRDTIVMWKSRLLTATSGKRLVWSHSDKTLKQFAQSVGSAIRGDDSDLYMFYGNAEFLKTRLEKPYACYTDTAFVPFLDTYHGGRNYSTSELDRLRQLEGEWLRQAAMVFTSSEYARNVMLENYNLDREQIAAVGIGANIDYLDSLPAPSGRRTAVLFVATDFERKGGRLAVDVVELARRQIPDLTLEVIGQDVPEECCRDFVRSHGWIDKKTAAGKERFESLMKECSLYLLLSSADLTPIAICEAFAYAVPVLAVAVGGIPEMIRDGETGWLTNVDSTAQDVAERLVAALTDDAKRSICAQRGREAYETTWNWDAVALKITDALKAHLHVD